MIKVVIDRKENKSLYSRIFSYKIKVKLFKILYYY